MRINKISILLTSIVFFSLSIVTTVVGQNVISFPSSLSCINDKNKELKKGNDISPFDFTLPTTFLGTKNNVIEDKTQSLSGIFKKLYIMQQGGLADTVRIIQIGDSHIRGLIYPQMVGDLLMKTFGSLKYTNIGINGATCHSFAKSKKIEKIFAENPDLIIISFGTNEGYKRHYDANLHYVQIAELVKNLRDKLPDVHLLFTTPPGSYMKYRIHKYVRITTKHHKKRYRYRYRKTTNIIYKVNPNNGAAVSTICKYANEHSLPYWDLFGFVGGEGGACQNWSYAQLMCSDHVHYLPEGYRLQGELLYQAFIKAYNEYVSKQF